MCGHRQCPDQHRQDTTNHLEQLRAFARTQRWRIVLEYVDLASGKNGDREQFKALFSAAPLKGLKNDAPNNPLCCVP
jgi:DNA invertase Pin-like site-specific DNA recombinase